MHLSDQDSSLSAGGLQDSAAGSGLAQTLQQEFSLVNLQIRNVNVEVSWCPMIVRKSFKGGRAVLLSLLTLHQVFGFNVVTLNTTLSSLMDDH